MPCLVEIDPAVPEKNLRRRRKCEKITTTTTATTTTKNDYMIRKAHLSLQAQVNLKVLENLPLEKATVWQIAKTHAMLS